jgi:hypothetical protein
MTDDRNTAAPPPAVVRLEEQIAWYDTKSQHSQRWYKGLKTTELIAAAGVPLAAGYGINWLAGGLGVVIVVIEGLQGMNQYFHNWITYRGTCEELRHEKYLWLSRAGPYKDENGSIAVLAERTEGLISREHTRWVSEQEKSRRTEKPAST